MMLMCNFLCSLLVLLPPGMILTLHYWSLSLLCLQIYRPFILISDWNLSPKPVPVESNFELQATWDRTSAWFTYQDDVLLSLGDEEYVSVWLSLPLSTHPLAWTTETSNTTGYKYGKGSGQYCNKLHGTKILVSVDSGHYENWKCQKWKGLLTWMR